MVIQIIEQKTRSQIKDFFTVHWGSSQMVTSTGVHDCSLLDGFYVTNDDHEIIGLITYHITSQTCEIISLDSLEENKGIGSQLMQMVEEKATQQQCNLLTLVTTNDNERAIRFYQHRGYTISQVIPNAVELARKIKPEIPLYNEKGVSIKDEIVLIKHL
ncbi:MAG TPA: GNAT family N-acetyltransferase [Exiguobacterium sp.]|nr:MULTISPECIES: GNAT family N-acetyltransferase [unclassified Exiguobacterium]MDT0174149.1 GNAT family N-acetyltransferase [Exiguobacterium sp. BRG2]HAL00576.1 GNAT family N-acetyltransferase [Exiguobacterium sp.]HBF58014.1 GNAT family N-acetyltransferase [Exiguobacterium sp.]